MRHGERENALTEEGEGETQQQHQESLHSTRRAHTRTHNVSDRAESSNYNGNPLAGSTRQLGKHKKKKQQKKAFQGDARDRSDKMKIKDDDEGKGAGGERASRKAQAYRWRSGVAPLSGSNIRQKHPKKRERACFGP